MLIGIGVRDLSRQAAVGIPPFEGEAVVGDDGHRRAVFERQKARVERRARPRLDLADGRNVLQSSGRVVAPRPVGIDRQHVVEIPREGLGVAVSVRVAHRDLVNQTGVFRRIYRSGIIGDRYFVHIRRTAERNGDVGRDAVSADLQRSSRTRNEAYLGREVARLLPIHDGNRQPLAGGVDTTIRRAPELGIGQVIGDFHLERVNACVDFVISLDANVERLYGIAPHVEVRGVVLAQIDVVGHLQPVLPGFDAHIGRTLRSVRGALLLLGRDGGNFAPTVFKHVERAGRLAALQRGHLQGLLHHEHIAGLLLCEQLRRSGGIHQLHGLQLQRIDDRRFDGDVADHFGDGTPHGNDGIGHSVFDRERRVPRHRQCFIRRRGGDLALQQAFLGHRAHVPMDVHDGVGFVAAGQHGALHRAALDVELSVGQHAARVVEEEIDVAHRSLVRRTGNVLHALLAYLQREAHLILAGRALRHFVFDTTAHHREQRYDKQ